VGGGGALRVFEIYRRLAGRVDATVASGRYPGARDEVVDGVRYRRLGAASPYAWSRWSYARAAERLLRTAPYDVAIYDFSVYTPIRLPAERPVGLVVHMLHGPTARGRWGRAPAAGVRAAERALLRRARWISTTSRWMEDQLRPLVSPGARVVRIGSGVPDEFFAVERRPQPLILFYGRFDLYQKGVDTALAAFARVRERHPELQLCLAGRGKDEAAIRSLARDLGVEDATRVVAGVGRDEVLELMRSALALVMPSRLEGLPMVPAEAMAAGVPVVAANVGALEEVVDPPHGGTLVPPDDPEATAAALLALVEDPVRREEISRSARASARRFAWDRVAEEHLAFLHAVAAW
jgi:glycosyltransferase involved in cell wall biosynthesis